MIKLALYDMDNTMLPLGEPYIPERSIQAIRACQELGIDVGPCSGRSRAELAQFFQNDASCYNTGVTINGMRIYLSGQLVYEVSLSNKALTKVKEIVVQHSGAALALYRDGKTPFWVGMPQEELGDMYHFAQLEAATRVDAVPNDAFMKAGIIFFADKDKFLALQADLEAACPEFDFVSTVDCWWDIIPRNVSKQVGVDILRKTMNLSLDEVCVFGDADNDLEMLRFVPNSVCVANGNERAHAAARWHIGASADGAVASALWDIAHAAQTGGMPAFMCEQNRNHQRIDAQGNHVD